MTVVLIVLGCLVGLLILMALIGLALPKGHVATVSTRFGQPPERIWTVLRDFSGYPDWQADVKEAERLADQDGLPRWRLGRGLGPPITFVVAEERPPELLVTQITGKGLPFGGSWVYEINPDGDDGCTLSVTERGEIYNPVFRFLSRFLLGHHGAMEKFVGALAKQLGEDVTPERG